MTYTVEISDAEYRALAYMSAKGYDCGVFEALAHEATRVVHVRGDRTTYSIPEYVIWECKEQWDEALESGNNPWGPFAEHELQSKLDSLFDEVV